MNVYIGQSARLLRQESPQKTSIHRVFGETQAARLATGLLSSDTR